MKKEILRIENLYGSYLEQTILHKVAFSIYENEILCIFGFSNSGKTTITNLLGGQIEGDWHKDVFRYGKRVRLDSLTDARSLGIFYVRSCSNVFPNLTIAENLYMKNDAPGIVMHYIDHIDIQARTRNILTSFGLDYDPSALASDLALSDRFMLEIIDAVLHNAKIIVLDCIQYFSSKADLNKLHALLRTLCSMGISIVYTCNTIDDDRLFADRILVMRDGMKTKEFTRGEYTNELLDAYGGGDGSFKLVHPPFVSPAANPFLVVNGYETSSGSVNFSLSKGETLVMYSKSKEHLQEIAESFRSKNMFFSSARLYNTRVFPKTLEKWFRKKCCIIDSLAASDVIFQNLSVLDNFIMNIPKRQVLRSNIMDLLYQSNRETIRKAESESALGDTSIATNMAILRQRILLSGFELCVFIKPELGLDPVSKLFVLREIDKLCDANIAIIIMTDNSSTIEKLNYRTIVV